MRQLKNYQIIFKYVVDITVIVEHRYFIHTNQSGPLKIQINFLIRHCTITIIFKTVKVRHWYLTVKEVWQVGRGILANYCYMLVLKFFFY